jgi:putative restriction endonuclease
VPSTTGWTRQQLLVALHLYCQIPFGKMHSLNPEIIKYAELIERTPSALAMKLINIASLDPAVTSTGRTGLRNVSATDRAMWEEMQADWQGFAAESLEAVDALGVAAHFEQGAGELDIPDEGVDYTGSNKLGQAMIRVGQAFFRRAVLSAYDYRCCITGLAVPELLLASHIVPWRVDPTNRLNPRNGLCLSALHDRSFDAGIITIAENMAVTVTGKYAAKDDHFFEAALLAYDGQPIALPEKFRPDSEFLNYHRRHVFQG